MWTLDSKKKLPCRLYNPCLFFSLLVCGFYYINQESTLRVLEDIHQFVVHLHFGKCEFSQFARVFFFSRTKTSGANDVRWSLTRGSPVSVKLETKQPAFHYVFLYSFSKMRSVYHSDIYDSLFLEDLLVRN